MPLQPGPKHPVWQALLVASLAGASLPALASDWRFVGVTDAERPADSTSFFVDFSSIHPASSTYYMQAWVRYDNTKKKTENVAGKSVTYDSTLILYNFDCRAKMFDLMSFVYKLQGRVTASRTVQTIPGSLSPVVPDSMGEALLTIACSPTPESTLAALKQ